MAVPRKFYKTVITFEVLSEEPLGEAALSLKDIAYMTDEGDCVGRFGGTVVTELTRLEAANALYDFGSEPGFFMLDDEGRPIERPDHVVALLDAQGTACIETALYDDEDTPENRAKVEAQFCHTVFGTNRGPDHPSRVLPGTWIEVSENEAFWRGRKDVE